MDDDRLVGDNQGVLTFRYLRQDINTKILLSRI